MTYARYWKSIIAVTGLLVTVLTRALEPAWGDNVPSWVPVLAAVLTAVGVYAKRNEDDGYAPPDLDGEAP